MSVISPTWLRSGNFYSKWPPVDDLLYINGKMTSCVQPNCFDSKDDQFLPSVPRHAWSVMDNLPSTFHGWWAITCPWLHMIKWMLLQTNCNRVKWNLRDFRKQHADYLSERRKKTEVQGVGQDTSVFCEMNFTISFNSITVGQLLH